jgi:hypothetical protein
VSAEERQLQHGKEGWGRGRGWEDERVRDWGVADEADVLAPGSMGVVVVDLGNTSTESTRIGRSGFVCAVDGGSRIFLGA